MKLLLGKHWRRLLYVMVLVPAVWLGIKYFKWRLRRKGRGRGQR